MDLCQKSEFHVVLMDVHVRLLHRCARLVLMSLVQMPGMDGLAATQTIRKFGQESLAIVGLSADATRDCYQRCADSGEASEIDFPPACSRCTHVSIMSCVGMNTFLTKPIIVDALKHTLSEFVDMAEGFIIPIMSSMSDDSTSYRTPSSVCVS